MSIARSPAELAKEPAHLQVGYAFRAVQAAMRRLRGRDTHRQDGLLSYAQFGLLFGLADGKARSARELGAAAALSPATVAQMLDDMEHAGLVERTRSQTDRRVVLTSLTRHGRMLVDAQHAHMEKRWERALAGFSQEELGTARAVLDKIAKLFTEMADATDE